MKLIKQLRKLKAIPFTHSLLILYLSDFKNPDDKIKQMVKNGEIMKMAKLDCNINPIETFQYPTPVSRPYYSVLNKSKIKKEFSINIPYWKDSLSECLRILGEKNNV